MVKELFLSNDSKVKFIDRLHVCFRECDAFKLTVSFIKSAGLSYIKRDIEEALKRGVKGQIITSTYQNFTDIAALELFKKWQDEYSNFECKLDIKSLKDNRGYHSKGYIFKINDHYEMLIGSTNITKFALLKNVEWNMSVRFEENDPALEEANREFKYFWAECHDLDKEVIEAYRVVLANAYQRWDMDNVVIQDKEITENSMQRKALEEIDRYRRMGEDKALVVASTGSGKTYLSAFDAKQFDAEKLLFVVHRDTILVEAQKTFAKVFKKSRTYGFFTGQDKNIDADFIFATNRSLADNIEMFKKDQFDYIVLDECHHGTASTYQKIINYFEPQFLLGLTATPERMDNEDVFDIFNKNVPYELRLRDAIKYNLVVPFHYYGIRDEQVDYSDQAKKYFSNTAYSDEHAAFVAKEIEKHRPHHTKLKALAFCRDVAHAAVMAEKLEYLGYGTTCLTGKDDTNTRIQKYQDLQNDDNELEIICTVDILNEGVDIPCVNMVLFLRPTQSQTIFIQQLGRGLRKYDDKEFLTVLDFIGNSYDRSVQVALALSGLTNSTYIEKPLLDQLVRDNFSSLDIPGVEIYFDEYSQEEILKYIEKTNFNTKRILMQDYFNFKKYLDCKTFPTHLDYLNSDCAPDLMRLIKSRGNGRKHKCYYNFLKYIEEPNIPAFNPDQIRLLCALSEMLPLTRKEEFLIVKEALESDLGLDNISIIKSFNKRIDDDSIESALNYLSEENVIRTDNNKIIIKADLTEAFKDHLLDLLTYGLDRYDEEFGDFDGEFKLYGNYMSQQVMLQLVGRPDVYQQGTKHDIANRTTYIFVCLKKDETNFKNLQYKDKFLSPDIFQWESVNNTTLDNAEGKKLLNSEKVHIFIRKVREEDGIRPPFTYFGTGKFEPNPKVDSNEGKPTLLFRIKLDNAVKKEYRYDFLVPDKELPEA